MAAAATAVRVAMAVTLAASAVACTDERGDGRRDQRPSPTVSPPRFRAGMQVTLTASVVRVIGPMAFVVSDADLPPEGQLVVSPVPVDLRETELVTVTGQTARLSTGDLVRYGLPDPAVYAPFAEAVVVVAATVRRYVPRPTPTVA